KDVAMHIAGASPVPLYVSDAEVDPAAVEKEREILLAESEARKREYAAFLELRESVGQAAPSVREAAAVLAELDVYAALAEAAAQYGYVRPRFSAEGRLYIRAGRHPVVERGGEFIPNDLELSPGERLLILTGPNMAGKSTYLRQTALIALLAQIGSFIPAEEAELPLFDRIYTRIGASDDLAGGRSTFMVEMGEVAQILKGATEKSLVLLDEVGRGTSTLDGVALAQAVLEALLKKGCYGLVTTHLSPLKAFAQRTLGVRNASFRFDLEHLRPTYELVLGVPGRSYALAIARRLELGEEILARAEALLPQGGRLESLLEELEREKLALMEEKRRLEALLEEAERKRAELEEEKARWEATRQDRLAALEEEVARALRKTEAELKALKEKAKSGAKRDALRELMELRARYQKPRPAPPPLAPGSWVEVPYGGKGRVVELRGEEALVQVGAVKLALRARELRPIPAASRSEHPEEPVPKTPAALRPKIEAKEVDLRGLTVEEALLEVEEALQEALALGLPSLRLLHGKGTGALRRAIRERLRSHPHVEALEPTPDDGATVVRLAR
ncbi:MAG: endonuclease MutS2, partial [Thermus sp.]